MVRSGSQKKGTRKYRLSSLLAHGLSEYFKTEMELPGLVSISGVDVAPNMQVATIWLSVYGADEDEVLDKIRKESRRLRAYLIRSLSTRYTPVLTFRIDYSQQHADDISRALKKSE